MKNAPPLFKAPDWLYKQANISKTDTNLIRLELLKFIKNWTASNDQDLLDLKSQFVGVDIRDHDNFYKKMPTLHKVLKDFQIEDLLSVLAFIIVSHDTYFPIHIDCEDPGIMSFALNIPVLNCDDTVTVWYDTIPESNTEEYIAGTYHGKHATYCVQSEAKEVGRCDTISPHWVNIARPHAPMCFHSKLRINASLRFTPEIYYSITNGNFENKMIIN